MWLLLVCLPLLLRRRVVVLVLLLPACSRPTAWRSVAGALHVAGAGRWRREGMGPGEGRSGLGQLVRAGLMLLLLLLLLLVVRLVWV